MESGHLCCALLDSSDLMPAFVSCCLTEPMIFRENAVIDYL